MLNYVLQAPGHQEFREERPWWQSVPPRGRWNLNWVRKQGVTFEKSKPKVEGFSSTR